jgi:paraquat-inducible protein A
MSVSSVSSDDHLAAQPGAALLPLESFDDLTSCEECDVVYRKRKIECDEVARCPRCGSVVERGHRLGLEGQLALAVTALILFCLANTYSIITLDLRGVRSEATMAGALYETWQLQQRLVAVIAAFTAVVAPLMVIVLRLYVTSALAAGRVPPGFGLAMQLLRVSSRWSMVEVFMLGTLVAIVRVASLASVIPGVGIFSFGVLTLMLASLEATGTHGLWECAGSIRARDRAP